MLRGIVTVGGWTMVSRMLGFMRDIFIAQELGTGLVADAFFVALKLPNLFRRLFGEGAFNAAFVPAFAGTLAAEGRPAALKLAGEMAAVMTLWLAALAALGVVFMPQLMLALAPGFAASAGKFALTVELTRITFPYLMLICLAALLGGVLNGAERFAAAAAAPVLFNVFLIGALLVGTPFLPSAGHALAWGLLASGVAQILLLAVACQRAGMAFRVPLPRLSPPVRAVLRRMGPGFIGAGVTQLNVAVDTIIASLLPAGTVSVLYYADRVDQLPLGVIGAAVGTAILPLLSRQVRTGEEREALLTLNRGMEYALALTLPAALALVVLAHPVMRVLFAHGAFDHTAAERSAQALMAYAVGLPAYVLAKVLAPGFFARNDTKTPVKIGLAMVALNLVLNLAFMRPLQHIGPALATSLAAMCNVCLLGGLLARRGHFHLDQALAGRALRMLGAALVMAVVLVAGQNAQHVLLATIGDRLVWQAIALAALIGLGLLAYGAAGHVLGAFDMAEVRRMLRPRSIRLITTPPG